MKKPTALVVYGSNSGNTRMVGEWIAESLGRAYETVIRDVAHLQPSDFDGYDLLLLGTNSWLTDTGQGKEEGQLPSQWFSFAARLRGGYTLSGRKVAVFGCGRHEYTNFCGGVDHLERLVSELGGTLLGDSLRIDGFPHHQKETVRTWSLALVENPLRTEAPATPDPAPSVPNPGDRNPAASGTAAPTPASRSRGKRIDISR